MIIIIIIIINEAKHLRCVFPCVCLWRQVSWTQALRTIVKNCYKQHGREDLLYAFEDQQVTPQQVAAAATHSIAHLVPSQTVVQTISNPDGTVSLIQVSSGPPGVLAVTRYDRTLITASNIFKINVIHIPVTPSIYSFFFFLHSPFL